MVHPLSAHTYCQVTLNGWILKQDNHQWVGRQPSWLGDTVSTGDTIKPSMEELADQLSLCPYTLSTLWACALKHRVCEIIWVCALLQSLLRFGWFRLTLPDSSWRNTVDWIFLLFCFPPRLFPEICMDIDLPGQQVTWFGGTIKWWRWHSWICEDGLWVVHWGTLGALLITCPDVKYTKNSIPKTSTPKTKNLNHTKWKRQIWGADDSWVMHQVGHWEHCLSLIQMPSTGIH